MNQSAQADSVTNPYRGKQKFALATTIKFVELYPKTTKIRNLTGPDLNKPVMTLQIF